LVRLPRRAALRPAPRDHVERAGPDLDRCVLPRVRAAGRRGRAAPSPRPLADGDRAGRLPVLPSARRTARRPPELVSHSRGRGRCRALAGPHRDWLAAGVHGADLPGLRRRERW